MGVLSPLVINYFILFIYYFFRWKTVKTYSLLLQNGNFSQEQNNELQRKMRRAVFGHWSTHLRPRATMAVGTSPRLP